METTLKIQPDSSEADHFKNKFPGKGAPKQTDFLRKRLQGKSGGKYFDSGDYNVAKSTKKKDATIITGKAIPTPEVIPHRKPSSSQSNLLGVPDHTLEEKKVEVENEEAKNAE
ncbi:cAMP-regulated phosphoprotein 19 isoform X2 [Hydra vulgaris]|uniref:cAMP-regulated phosphoprotein 19 isoform X2 n=1 Tax=Hydra vulgaris TaxID=6087 RepID=A0ABM4DE24_HYDVU